MDGPDRQDFRLVVFGHPLRASASWVFVEMNVGGNRWVTMGFAGDN